MKRSLIERKLGKVETALDKAIEKQEIPGAVVLARMPREGEVLEYAWVRGLAAARPERLPMRRDTIFDLASPQKANGRDKYDDDFKTAKLIQLEKENAYLKELLRVVKEENEMLKQEKKLIWGDVKSKVGKYTCSRIELQAYNAELEKLRKERVVATPGAGGAGGNA